METAATPQALTTGERCIAFAVGPNLPAFVLPAAVLVEVVLQPIQCPLPGAPAALRRLIALRGTLLPLFDLAAWLGLSAPALPRVIAIGRGERAAAVLADGEPRVVEVFDDVGPLAAPAMLAPFVRAARDASGAPLWRFDHEAWFAVAAHSAAPPLHAAPRAAEAIS